MCVTVLPLEFLKVGDILKGIDLPFEQYWMCRYKDIGKKILGRETPAWIIAHLYIYTTSLQPWTQIHRMFKGVLDHRFFCREVRQVPLSFIVLCYFTSNSLIAKVTLLCTQRCVGLLQSTVTDFTVQTVNIGKVR